MLPGRKPEGGICLDKTNIPTLFPGDYSQSYSTYFWNLKITTPKARILLLLDLQDFFFRFRVGGGGGGGGGLK